MITKSECVIREDCTKQSCWDCQHNKSKEEDKRTEGDSQDHEVKEETSVDKFKYITKEMEELYEKKNHDYGDSYDKSLDEDGLLVAKIRLGDKFSRFSTLIKTDALIKDESIEDTLIDMANYAVMTLKWLRDKYPFK